MWKEFKNKKGRFLLIGTSDDFKADKGDFIFDKQNNRFYAPDHDFLLPLGDWKYLGSLYDVSFSPFSSLQKLVEGNGMGCWKNYLSDDPGNVYTCTNAYYSLYTFLTANILDLSEKNFDHLFLFFEPFDLLKQNNPVQIYFESNFKGFKGEKKLIGIAMVMEDGYYHFYPNNNNSHWSSNSLRYVADKLDELNKGWDEKIKESLNH